jgi:hypothetical protein
MFIGTGVGVNINYFTPFDYWFVYAGEQRIVVRRLRG